MHITVLGAGLVGRAMVLDLLEDEKFTVRAVDFNPAILQKLQPHPRLEMRAGDVSHADELAALVQGSDLIINAVPGFLGFNTLRNLMSLGQRVVDIAFSPEDARQLNDLALSRQALAVADCGIAPGMSNLLAARAMHQLDQTYSVEIYVGGLPKERRLPFEYKAVFSPIDVIEEYTRPARLIENGKVVVKTALTEPEFIDFPGVGTLEAFNTDGLRSLMDFAPAPVMKEKTLRYPGHREKMQMFRDLGFFNTEAVEIRGQMVVPLELTARLLFENWKLGPGEADITVMKICVRGVKAGQPRTISYYLYDEYDPLRNIHSMARTTGYTATTVARLILDGTINHSGVLTPEHLASQPGLVEKILKGLAEKNIIFRETTE